MEEPPPLPSNQRKADAVHLKWLAVFHFLMVGVAAIGFLFLCYYGAPIALAYSSAQMFGHIKPMPSPQEIEQLHQFFVQAGWRCFFSGSFLVATGGLNLFSGIFICRRKNRLFSLFVSGFNLLLIPPGSVLGIFTLVVLLRDSVQELYAAEKLHG